VIKLLKFIKTLLCKSRGCDAIKLPSYIYIVVNNKCNLKCKMCDVGQKVDSQFYRNMVKDYELTLNEWKNFIDNLVEIYPLDTRPCIAITSTEPLLYKDLFELIKYAKDNKFKVQLTTNGLLLPKFYKQIVESRVDELWLSVDGTENIHNSIRGNSNSFNNILVGLYQIINSEVYKSCGFPKIYLNYTITDKNYYNLIYFMEFVSFIPYELVCFSHLNFVTDYMANKHNEIYGNVLPATSTCIKGVNLDGVDIKVLWDQMNEIKSKYKNVVFSPNITSKSDLSMFYRFTGNPISKSVRCLTPTRVAQIFCNGDVGVSTRCFDITFGNIRDINFYDIWNGEKINAFRKMLSETENGFFPACTRCCGVFS
jgi:Fe-coproporphyrin III synthase